MKTTRRTWVLLLTLAVLSMYGCTPKYMNFTGFLTDYSQLRSLTSNELRYVAPAKDFHYSQFIIDPIEVHFHKKAKGGDTDIAELNKLTQYMFEAMHKALQDHYQVVRQPGPGVARIRVAITDIQKSSPALNVLPASKLMGKGIGGVSMEGEMLDSVTGRQMAAVVQSQKGEMMSLSGLSKYGDARAVIDDWAQKMVQHIAEANKPM
jgi:hypothetical protein